MSDKEFRIIHLKKFSELHEHTDKYSTKLGKQCMNKISSAKKEKPSKEKNPKQMNRNPRVEKYNELKNSIESFKNILDHEEESVI